MSMASWEVAVVYFAVSGVACGDEYLSGFIQRTDMTRLGTKGLTPERTINYILNNKEIEGRSVFRSTTLRNNYELNCPNRMSREAFAIQLLGEEKYKIIQKVVTETLAREMA